MTSTTPLEQFYLQQPEPYRSCFLALRDVILKLDPAITPEWKYKLPFFYYKGKMFCYLWYHKKARLPYIGIMSSKNLDFPELLIEKRASVKIMLIDPLQDLPVERIHEILNAALSILTSSGRY